MNLCATIVDDRGVDIVEKAISKHKPFLPANTKWIAWGSPEMYLECRGAIGDCEVFPFGEKVTIDVYNKLLTTKDFWEYYKDFDRVLIFQADSGLLRTDIEEFYKWDYIGAEWPFVPHVGNGGLSLRNPKTMWQICESVKYDYCIHGPEDTYFCNIMKQKGMNLATVEEARRFGVESVFTLGSMGYHAIEKYLTPDQCKQIYEQYN